MLDYVINNTLEYLESKSKIERKKIGQFFTSKETAIYMASIFSNIQKKSISILDPGSGSGILVAALIDRLQESAVITSINVTCYENNSSILPLLHLNMEYLKNNSKVIIKYQIIEDNYILSQKDEYNNQNQLEQNRYNHKYDFVIGNPPYLKIPKDAPEAIAMSNICYGAPNLYFLFASMSLYNLKNDGEMVYIIPRSWTSGAYFKKFREYLLSNAIITHIHLFVSRDKVFDTEQVLQETIIIKLVKTKNNVRNIQISSSTNNKDFQNSTSFAVPYYTVISGSNLYVYLVTSQEEVKILNKINLFNCKLEDIGLKMRTGLTVDFRNRELLQSNPGDHVIPLIYSQHIKNGYVEFPIGKDYEYMLDSRSGMIQQNKNYLFLKRFTSKEEKRRLQCGMYLSNNFSNFSIISTHNKINFIDTIDSSEMSEELVYGLYVIFNSTYYDTYYRILNGSTQVNSTEVNSMPIPSKQTLTLLGKKLKGKQSISVETCDMLLEELFI